MVKVKLWISAAAASLIIQSASAHPAAPDAQPPAASDHGAHEADAAAVRAVLADYKSAIERLDATGTERLFASDAQIFESGGAEGSYTTYLAHHLGPELAEFKSFSFSDYKIEIRFEGAVALATETYNYRIETKAGEIAERRGVATSVLRMEGRSWKIVQMHNSSRRPAQP